jgi:methylase of polypeptide subunit release factors
MPADTRISEMDFCAEVAKFCDAIFAANPSYPFQTARIEGYGKGASRARRKDLRVYDREGKLALCGEVKLPGTPEGRSAYDDDLVRDAARKADDAVVQFFFTWNVNTFVLWDRKRWDVPLPDRRVRDWQLGMHLACPEDAGRPDVLGHIQKRFLPALFADLSEIYSGRRRDWFMPPDDIFIHSMESHLEWPISITRAWVLEQADRSKPFDTQLQEWLADQDWTFIRNDAEQWFRAIHNAACTLCYLLMNRLIFYKALYDRFEDLPILALKPRVRTAAAAYAVLQELFENAVRRSGDYEPLFYPHERDWASLFVLQGQGAIQAWQGVLRAIGAVDFRKLPSDIVGRIFQRLIGPEERHRYGQHFTGDDVVDLINSFCIRTPEATVLDPACGSGSFLVRAYYRKKTLQRRRTHLQLLGELFGCDIALYPAHLATLNLAARQINDEANYPRIARRNFFEVTPDKPFCKLPTGAGGTETDILLPSLDAVVGNPPYVRQEKIELKDKSAVQRLVGAAWPGLRLSGRADLHCYFWPAASRFLTPRGYFGFLTSSSWLDVEYGFALQGWVLKNFRVLAVMESSAEPWFPDARVKTCVTILQRCDDEAERMATRVKFVQFKEPLSAILGVAAIAEHEAARQMAAERLRRRIEEADTDWSDSQLRIIVKSQAELWNDGVRAGRVLDARDLEARDAEDEEGVGGGEQTGQCSVLENYGDYRAGKWGRYVRAPDLYFEMMREFGHRFVPLGEIAAVRFGVKTGCDAFFMPRDLTAEALSQCPTPRDFRRRFGVERGPVENGAVKIIKAGDGSVHPIEAIYLAPEVHSPMQIDRPVVRSADLSRVVLLVGKPLSDLKDTRVARYLRYGDRHPFASRKSDPVPVSDRTSCAARDPWYDLTGLVAPGIAFWPMAQQYRHIIAANPERLICNHNLFDLSAPKLPALERQALVAILNCTMVALFKTFYGRFAGTEGNLKTEVVDVKLLEVPDPRRISESLAARLLRAFDRLTKRPIGRLVENQLMLCHTSERARRIAEGPIVLPSELQEPDRQELDDAVFELLGISSAERRRCLIQRLYEETARHFRAIRVVEIQKMEQRAKATARRFSADDLAADIWDAAEIEDLVPLQDWLAKQPELTAAVDLPEIRPAWLSEAAKMFDNETVYFGKDRKTHMICQSRDEAELIKFLADLGISGLVQIPRSVAGCVRILEAARERVSSARARFEELSASRTSLDQLRDKMVSLLMRWFVHGRPVRAQGA